MTVESNLFKNKKVCLINSNHKTYIAKNGVAQWYRYKNGFICLNCRNKIISNPKRLNFKDKKVVIKKKFRIGVCSWCNKKKGDNYINKYGEIAKIKRIGMHHIQYHENDPLRDTLELCQSCHNRETWRLWRLKKRNN